MSVLSWTEWFREDTLLDGTSLGDASVDGSASIYNSATRILPGGTDVDAYTVDGYSFEISALAESFGSRVWYREFGIYNNPDFDPDSVISDSSVIKLYSGGVDDNTSGDSFTADTFEITFTHEQGDPVQNARFMIGSISGDGQVALDSVKITAYNGTELVSTDSIVTTLFPGDATPADDLSVTDGTGSVTVDGEIQAHYPQNPQGAVQVQITEQFTKIVVEYVQLEESGTIDPTTITPENPTGSEFAKFVLLSDIHFNENVPEVLYRSDYGDGPDSGDVFDDPRFDPDGYTDELGQVWYRDPFPDNHLNNIEGTPGADVIQTGDDADTIDGRDGNDTLDGGIDDDLIYGRDGNDSIIGDHGSDTIYGNDGDDFIEASDPDPNDDGSLLFMDDPDATDLFPNNDMDVVDGGTGNDTIFGGDDNDSLHGGTGTDFIDGGIDNDTISGGRHGDFLFGNDGDDLILGYNHDDTLDGGEGSPTLPLDGDLDTLIGGAGDDTLYGGSQNDTIWGGTGHDVAYGGEDRDLFVGTSAFDWEGDRIDGNESGDDWDTLDFRPLDAIEQGTRLVDDTTIDNPYGEGGTIFIDFDAPNSENGTATFFDSHGDQVGDVLEFSNIENVVAIIPCFTPGTRIATPRGEVNVEDLQVGDRVITRDNGIQEIRWLGTRALDGHEIGRRDNLRPVRIRAGALGNGMPARDMQVSPNHRMLVASERASFYFEEREVLVAAKHLVGMPDVDYIDVSEITYIHFMFDQHEIVLSDGTWSESFQPGDYSLQGVDQDQRQELLELFPELAEQEGLEAYQAARRSLKRYEAQLLIQ